jgi:flagellar hook assembly protein FlgD
VLTSADGKLGKTVLDGMGKVKISDANVKRVVIMLANVDLPKVYALGQNYPNPFNPSTTFNVDIPRVSDVDIKVYDVLGREITTLLSGQQPAGSLRVKWDGRDAHGLTAPTGIYFVRMTADGFTDSRKIMLMK